MKMTTKKANTLTTVKNIDTVTWAEMMEAYTMANGKVRAAIRNYVKSWGYTGILIDCNGNAYETHISK